MTARLPRITAKQIIKVLELNGFVLTRQSGGHKIFKSEVGRRVTVPAHAGKILHPKLLKSILVEADLTTESLLDLLK